MSGDLFDRLATVMESRYRLERELGVGGMATVFLAEDLRHHRSVAIKVLRPELAAALGHDRFLREITTTANLRHPNILPLFDSGEGDGCLYYVMPFVEGESLRERLRREGALPVEEALQIADEVADALSYAHARGVVHRDIKPENIMLENGHAIVADFGIAHALSAAGDSKLTQAGLALGTPHYMSPEQASGETVDARSDLYALGCVVHEMLSGKPPFDGPNTMAILAQHAVKSVPSIESLRPGVAPAICAAVERALAKSPDDRFATLSEWRSAVKSAAGSGELSIASGPRAAVINKLPPNPVTPLLGREKLLDDAAEKLRSGVRLLTVSGYGGTGKTRFAIELLRRTHSDYPGGAAFVSLASVTSPDDLLPAVATALDISEAHGRSALDAISTVIGERRVLLVLDNLEQIVDAAGGIATLISRCPRLKIIATSRAPLKISAETEFALPPLDLPPKGANSVDDLLGCPSVALFVERARKVQRSFQLSADNAKSVAEICRQLDGLPLALELAAARIRVLDPSALLQRLDHALDLLTSGDRDLPLRQRTLRTTISWSYSLLDEAEQQLLRRASVFHEGWTLAAMEQVCYDDDQRWMALDQLDSLVEKALVRVIGSGERYSLLETIRAFAAEQLHASGEVSATRESHADYFVRFARDVDSGIRDERQLESMRHARAEYPNSQAAIEWLAFCARNGGEKALERGLLLCGYLNWPWHITGLHVTARAAVDEFLALAKGKTPSLGRTLSWWTSTMVCTVMGDLDRAHADVAAGVADAASIGNAAVAAELAMASGYVHLVTGRVDDARRILDDSIARSADCSAIFIQALAETMKALLLFSTGDLDGGIALIKTARDRQQRIADYEGGGMAASFLAQMIFAKGDYASAIASYREALALFDAVGDRPEIARVHCELGWAALAAGDVMQAQSSFERAVTVYEEVGSARGTGHALLGLAAVEAADGRDESAVAIAEAANELMARAGVVVQHPMDSGVVARIEALKATIPQATLAKLQASGRVLSPSGVLELVGRG